MEKKELFFIFNFNYLYILWNKGGRGNQLPQCAIWWADISMLDSLSDPFAWSHSKSLTAACSFRLAYQIGDDILSEWWKSGETNHRGTWWLCLSHNHWLFFPRVTVLGVLYTSELEQLSELQGWGLGWAARYLTAHEGENENCKRGGRSNFVWSICPLEI